MARRSSVSVVVAVAAATLLAGCSAPPVSAERQRPGEDTLIAGVQESVSGAAYESGYQSFVDCMNDKKAQVVGAERVGRVWSFSISQDDADEFNECYRDFQPVDTAWQLANEYQSPTQVALRKCLSNAGVTPAKSVDAVWRQLRDHAIDPVACTTGQTK